MYWNVIYTTNYKFKFIKNFLVNISKFIVEQRTYIQKKTLNLKKNNYY